MLKLHTLGSACNEFGYNKHLLTTSRLLCIKTTDCNVKKFGYKSTRLQRVWLRWAPTYNEQFLLHFFTGCKRDPVYIHGNLKWQVASACTKMTSWRCLTCWPVKLWHHKMMSLVNKSADWTPNYHKILIFSPPKSLKSLRAARIDELTDSNEPAKI